MEKYDAVFKSRGSYYNILKSARITWQKANQKHPRQDPEQVRARNQEIADLLEELKPQIESGELAVYSVNECHLLGDDGVGYLWADKKDRGFVDIPNQRDRQTYYKALNLLTNNFIVSPYEGGNGKNTVKFLEELKKHHPPHQKFLLIGEGASYHRG
ncbi:winged helix-turn-helix domain-containing protein [Phormidium sp. CCY1219]|uniref:winged helix-turn-helix domain-containing protein n=1 Tax=Phormidium sp. CCY1219 TaxID=2886104 RepID=UPI002D1EE73B|nr:winged helix-turn-helix domain-containing protein [Phormidium sp. CCY1219]MEB3830096.1 transposase [Phormidium sp. CCY1219]